MSFLSSHARVSNIPELDLFQYAELHHRPAPRYVSPSTRKYQSKWGTSFELTNAILSVNGFEVDGF